MSSPFNFSGDRCETCPPPSSSSPCLPGAGKTTLARRLEAEHRALRLTPDEWMVPLFGVGDVDGKRDVLEGQLLWSVAVQALTLGVNVVLDYGLWQRAEREEYRGRGEGLGARVEFLYLDIPHGKLWRRLEERNRDLPPHTFPVTRGELDEWLGWFEPPTPDEVAQGRWRILGRDASHPD